MFSLPTLNRFLVKVGQTKRSPGMVNGKRGVPILHLESIRISVLYPAEPDLKKRMGIETTHELLTVFAEESDVKEGDWLVVDGVEYPIRSCAFWSPGVSGFLSLVVEDLK